MFQPDLVIRGHRIVTPRGTRPAAIHVRRGRVIGVVDFDDVPDGCPVDDADGVVLPGLVDTRVYVHTCASAEDDGFEKATRAAAAGGITTIVNVPFEGCSPTTTVPALETKRRRASGKCWVDVGFWAGAVPGNTRDLRSLFEAGVLGFACSLLPCADRGFSALSEADLRVVMPGLRNIGATLIAHAELPTPVEGAGRHRHEQRRWLNPASWLPSRSARYATYLESRPKAAENAGVALLAQLCREYQTITHVVSLSSSDALTPLFHARAARLPVTAETSPHYLNLVAEDLIDDAAALLAGAPPIRERENRELLWAAIAHGLIQMTAADRFTPLELSLPLMWSGAHGRGYPLDRVADWMAGAPARLAGLTRKGKIDVGCDADLVVFQPDVECVAESAPVRQRHAYRGVRLRGVVERTYLRGERIYSRTHGWAPSPGGTLVVRTAP